MGAIASSLRRDDEVNAVAPVLHLHGDDDAENCTEFDVSLRDEAIEWDEFMDDYLDELGEQDHYELSGIADEWGRDMDELVARRATARIEPIEDSSVDIMEVLEAVEAAEIIADLATASEAYSAFGDDGTRCAECRRDFDSEGLVWKIHYNNCASCSASICPACYLVVPLLNGKMCGCCGEWHCDFCYNDHEVESGYVDE